MNRSFTEHYKRRVYSLDGEWKFITDPEKRGVNDAWYKGIPATDTATVPSVWNTRLDLLSYEGACWYEREFYFDGGAARFVFGAVMTEAQIWLDGEPLGSHYGGFCQFDFVVPNLARGEHKLTVRVDNSFDEKSIPQAKVDWYHYGGIIRSVSLEQLDGVCVLSNRLEYTLKKGRKSADARLVLEVYNASAEPLCDTVCVSVADAEISVPVSLKPYALCELTSKQFSIKGFKLWDISSPNLYTLKISTSTDDLIDRVGFREVEVKNNKILLNGKKIEILGVNRHEEFTECGFAVPPVIMRRDIDLIEDLSCNAVRGSHYPNSPYFVDMLDERGLTFWSEIPIWGGGFSEKALADADVVERGLNMHREMLKHYYNHPSIIIWGMHNEIPVETKAAYEMSRVYYNYLKENGGNRIVSYATHTPDVDICMEFCDVICINMYIGWYGGDMSGWQGWIDSFRERRASLGLADKPVIMSEFGGAAVWGHRSFDDIRWSEEYQARLLGHCLELFHKDPMIVGMYIWQFADIRTCYEMGLGRARSYNNKGILNEHRNPKASYFKVRELYGKYKN